MLLIRAFLSTAMVYLFSSLQAVHANLDSLTLPTQSSGSIELLLPSSEQAQIRERDLQAFVGTANACCNGRTPIAGRYTLFGNRLIFKPQFEFLSNQPYTVRWRNPSSDHTPANEQQFTLNEFELPGQQPTATTEVVAIYPSGPVIPENTLRFFILFSTPMTPHLSADQIKLTNSKGVVDKAAFMSFKQELWNHDRTRLTLLIDPGRIKRGVAQNVTLGSALIEGDTYTLIVEDWPSAVGGKYSKRFTKSYRVSQPLRTLPRTSNWDWTRPRALTKDPLIIKFDRPFDHSNLKSAIRVLDDHGARIDGTVHITHHETEWRFEPDTPWTGSHINITVDAKLEDVAGNNFRTLLDQNLISPKIPDSRNSDTKTSNSIFNSMSSEIDEFRQRIWLKPISEIKG